MRGLHLTADLHGCAAAAALLADADGLRALALRAVRAAGLTPLGDLFHRFGAPGGVTGMVLLAESHLALHTWPELAAATLDVYVCNRGADNSAAAEALLSAMEAAFAPLHSERRCVVRGDVTAPIQIGAAHRGVSPRAAR
ncbi:MAG: adenosylmethionine decarboxylase [Burkholderiales bacterium]|nr:adenosylmethionine decarboxylase [Burkholderiales bacterium]